MLRYCFKLAIRHLSSRKKYSLINLAGLSIGFTAVILIALYVHRELTYDSFHSHTKNTYLLEENFSGQNLESGYRRTLSSAETALIKNKISGIINITLLNFSIINEYNNFTFSYRNQLFKANDIVFCDSAFRFFFDFKLIQGDWENIFSTSNSIILTKSFARKIFGSSDVIGEELQSGNSTFTVKGILQDPPDNSSIQFSGLIPFTGAKAVIGRNITDASNSAFIQIDKAVDPANIANKILKVLRADYSLSGTSNITSIHLIPLRSLYFRTPLPFEKIRYGNMHFVYIILSVGVVILLLALINFINIYVALQSKRMKEFGLGKISGAGWIFLSCPFIFEALILCLAALFIAFMLVEILFTYFNHLIEYGISENILFQPAFIFTGILSVILIAVISGIIPIFYFKQYNVLKIVKEEITRGPKGSQVRKGLIVFQFMVMYILIAITFIIQKQLAFINNKNLGFKKKNLVEIEVGYLNSDKEAFKNDIINRPHITGYGLSELGIGSANEWVGDLLYRGTKREVHYYAIPCDSAYPRVMGFEFIRGNNFLPGMNENTGGIILNETAMKEFGISDDPLEATINDIPVIGIVKDFNFRSLHEQVSAVGLLYRPKYADFATIRIDNNDPTVISETMDYLEKTWKKYDRQDPFDYTFLDQRIDNFYKKERKQSKAFIDFSVISIILAGLGLFSLSILSIELRTKEIGIRKVNGASLSGIINLLFRDFTILVIIAVIIAFPVSLYLSKIWLERFAYKTAVTIWLFLLTGSITFLIAWISIFWQSVKAARRNPVDALRYE